ncbi:ubiquinone biosynthesis protein COQ7-domain-containing protein [Elsinoe ampelina]|uniref:5-demethoxyubiquinone hydroxylase, mitochondrial n=1 Tax=Elsinoe ampelina TaxID=302913 RepID=A0A6A6GEI2_9PEZI|nr:ubiquinone biosynthesis protein COQ7-domain-containing protein [Elsinoe ampelina]
MLPLRTVRPLSRRWALLEAPRHTATITSSAASPATEPKPKSVEGKTTQKRTRPLSDEQRKFLDSALRVNHAGELAAVRIYAAQTPPVVKAHPHLRPLMKHMYDQEAGHFKKFNEMLAKHRIRPTIMYPVWQVAATALGWTTAIMGREAAMACTEAVETEIGEHYNGQVREILGWIKDMEDRGEEPGEELTELIKDIRRIRDEELEHLDHAVEHDAKEAQPYDVLTNVIRGGCRAAIWVSEKV